MWRTSGMNVYRLIFILMAALVTCTLSQGKPTLGCRIGHQQVISYNGNIISPINITASNEDVNVNPDNYIFHRNNIPLRLWCTQPLLDVRNDSRGALTWADLGHREAQNLLIKVNLTRPALITQIGSSGFSNGFVNNFTLVYETEAGNTTVYSQWNLYNEKEFVVPKIDTVFTLDQPFVAGKLEFQINDGVISPSGRLCWHLTLFGCTGDYVITKQPAPSKKTMSSLPSVSSRPSRNGNSACPTPSIHSVCPTLSIHSVCPTPSVHFACPTSSVSSVCTQLTVTTTHMIETHATRQWTAAVPTHTPIMMVVKDYQTLVIALPAAVATIFITVCIVAVGVCICLRNEPNGRWKDNNGLQSSQILSTSSNTLRIVENGTLYKSSSLFMPLMTGEGRSLSEAPKQGTSTNRVTSPTYENVLRTREPLPSNESGYYEPINLISDDSSMVRNPTYSVPLPVGPGSLRSLPPTPLLGPQTGGVTGSNNIISMVDNECYCTPQQRGEAEMSISQSFSNKLPNEYETPV